MIVNMQNYLGCEADIASCRWVHHMSAEVDIRMTVMRLELSVRRVTVADDHRCAQTSEVLLSGWQSELWEVRIF
jgi:hypothetical protein